MADIEVRRPRVIAGAEWIEPPIDVRGLLRLGNFADLVSRTVVYCRQLLEQHSLHLGRRIPRSYKRLIIPTERPVAPLRRGKLHALPKSRVLHVVVGRQKTVDRRPRPSRSVVAKIIDLPQRQVGDRWPEDVVSQLRWKFGVRPPVAVEEHRNFVRRLQDDRLEKV